jgi:hypothetical protein
MKKMSWVEDSFSKLYQGFLGGLLGGGGHMLQMIVN